MTRTVARFHLAQLRAVDKMSSRRARLSQRSARGATLLEYAILAGFAVALGGMLWATLGGKTGPVQGLLNKMSDLLKNT